jgi:PEP-CTERM motif
MNSMKNFAAALILAASASLVPVQAALVNIDLSGAVGGTVIDGVGADFAQRFSGQTVAGAGITGAPTGPLTLQGAGNIDVAFFDPGVSAASNSLLSQPGNAAPLSILFDSAANAFSWTMGSAAAGSTILASFFDLDGDLLGSQSVVMTNGYGLYSLSGFGTFYGITFSDNNDSAGVRFQNMSYNSVAVVSDVPEPGSLALLGLGLIGLAAARKRKQA